MAKATMALYTNKAVLRIKKDTPDEDLLKIIRLALANLESSKLKKEAVKESIGTLLQIPVLKKDNIVLQALTVLLNDDYVSTSDEELLKIIDMVLRELTSSSSVEKAYKLVEYIHKHTVA